MVYDSSRDRLYVTIQGAASRYPNTVTTIDPRAAAVTASLPIGSDPNVVALSTDASTLWVGMDGSFSMRKVTLSGATPVVGPLHHLVGPTSNGIYSATDLRAGDAADVGLGRYRCRARQQLRLNEHAGRLRRRGAAREPKQGDLVPHLHLQRSARSVLRARIVGDLDHAVLDARALDRDRAGDLPRHRRGPGRRDLVQGQSRLRRGHGVRREHPVDPHGRGHVAVLWHPLRPHQPQPALHALEREWRRFAPADQHRHARAARDGGHDPHHLPRRLRLRHRHRVFGRRRGRDARRPARRTGPPRPPARPDAGQRRRGSLDRRGRPRGKHDGHGRLHGHRGIDRNGRIRRASAAAAPFTRWTSPGSTCATTSRGLGSTPCSPTTPLTTRTRCSRSTCPARPCWPRCRSPRTPRQMALADDGKTLWLGFDSSKTISKFDVSNTPPVSVAVDTLPSVTSGVGFYDLAPLPGSATSIAATIGGQVAILDDGVARPTIANGRLSISVLAPGPSGTLFGLDTSARRSRSPRTPSPPPASPCWGRSRG